MARKPRVSPDQIDKARMMLSSLSPRDNTKTTKEAVENLSKDINEAVKKGYTLEEISKILEEQGISVQPSTLKAYWIRPGSKTNKKAKDKEKTQGIGDQNTNNMDTEIPTEPTNFENGFVKQDTPLENL